MQQQEQVVLNTVEILVADEPTVAHGPVPLAPELLSWISGGVANPITDLPNATW